MRPSVRRGAEDHNSAVIKHCFSEVQLCGFIFLYIILTLLGIYNG